MGGQFGIGGGYNQIKRLGAYDENQREQLKQMGLEYQAFNRDMSIMAQMLKQQQMQQMMRAYYAGNSGGGGGGSASGIGDSLKSLVETGIGLFNNIKSNKSENTQQTSQTPQTSSPQSNSAPQVSSGGGSAPSGLVQGVNTSSSSASSTGMRSLDNIASKLNNPNISTEDLNALKGQLGQEKVNVAGQLAEAQADYSNIQSQLKVAESNVTRLEGEVGNAEAAKTDAQNTLKDNTSQLNQSVKARDQLDDQLSSVNSEYKEQCTNVKNCESEKSSAQNDVSSAKTSVAQAESGVTMATQQLSAAQNTLGSTPQTINGQPNPAYASAQAAVKSAERQKEQAETALDKANKSLEEANSRLNTAEENLQSAQDAKHETLQNLQETDSEYKDAAKRCETAQKGVEASQDNYDASLETFDEASANYEKLNTELESQEGIVNQLEVYEAKVENLQSASTKVDEMSATIDEKLQAREQAAAAMLEHADATSGCSAAKTPAENLLSMENGPQRLNQYAYTEAVVVNEAGMMGFDISQARARIGDEIIHSDASLFENSGCISNADGSYTNTENGMTWINLEGDTWIRTDCIGDSAGYLDMAKEKYPDVVDAYYRAQEQRPDYGIQGLRPNDNLMDIYRRRNNIF